MRLDPKLYICGGVVESEMKKKVFVVVLLFMCESERRKGVYGSDLCW